MKLGLEGSVYCSIFSSIAGVLGEARRVLSYGDGERRRILGNAEIDSSSDTSLSYGYPGSISFIMSLLLYTCKL